MKKRNKIIAALPLIFFFSGPRVFAQADLCSGVGAGTTLPINTSCVTTAYNVPATFGNEIASPTCGTSYRDGWYRFTTSATQNFVTITATTDRDVGLAIYSGACGSLVQLDCRNASTGATTETLSAAVSPSTTYYLRVFRANNANANSMLGNICITSPSVVTSCSTTSLDPGGAGNYAANTNYTVVYCPSVAGQCISAAFSAFNTEAGFDFLAVHNGNSVFSPQLSGSPFSGTTSPGTITATTSNSSGCLTFHFTSDGTNQAAGWSASISCATCASGSPSVAQDCYGGATVCNDASFSGNSSGSGNDNDLTVNNEGCLSGEHQSSWYFFSPSTSGTVALNITPSSPTDDYDFAIWGPMAGVDCPPQNPPIRCSWAATTGTTGLNSSAGTQTSEGATGDGFVAPLTVSAGQKYMLVVDNYSSSTSPFTLDWVFSGGASLNCTVLGIQLAAFTGEQEGEQILLGWRTLSETRNDHFTLEKSIDGQNFRTLEVVPGAGTSAQEHVYTYTDAEPATGMNYYRLTQTDQDGHGFTYDILPVKFNGNSGGLVMEAYPVPARETLQLQFSENIEENTMIYLTDLTGRVLMTEQLKTENGRNHVLQVLALTKGIYFIMAENSRLNKKSTVKKIVIE
jgi:hypothetical protein